MSQPPGFEDHNNPDYIFKLKKALYGLKQAPQQWYERLSNFLLSQGYERGKTYKTLFIKDSCNDLILVQVYVDDIIFGSTNESLCEQFVATMQGEFEMSMIGELNFFLGLQVKQVEHDLFLCQVKYCRELLKKFNMENCKRSFHSNRKKPEFRIAYAMLISSFIEYYDIDVENELSEEVKAHSEITVATLNKIGLKKVNENQWICKASAEEDEMDGDGTSATAEQFTREDLGTGEQSYSSFEQLRVNQLNSIETHRRSHHEYCETHFQNIEKHVDDIQGKLGQMFYGPDD